MIKILVDTLGGDKSPDANIQGGMEALKKFDDLEIVFVGNEEIIKQKLSSFDYDKTRVSVINAPDEISANEQPTIAIRQKTNSSLYVGFETLRQSEDINAFVTSGSTGATLAGAVLRIGRIKGVKRPAFCPILPTMKKGIVALCDSGANAECSSLELLQFGVMASLYMQHTFDVKNPKVALLNIGTEEEKGDPAHKEAYALLKAQKDLNFVGNMESRDFLSGNYDVVVADGFSGNVLLKSTEGACLEMLKAIKSIMTKNLKTKFGALLLKKEVMEFKNYMDYNNYGGAVLLGCQKTIVKAHGSSKYKSICCCIEQAYNIEKNNLRARIADSISKTLA